MITSVYYSDIVRLISQPRYLSDVPSFSLPNFLNCANNLLALQIVTLMINTIEYLFQVLKDKQILPLFKVTTIKEIKLIIFEFYPLIK